MAAQKKKNVNSQCVLPTFRFGFFLFSRTCRWGTLLCRFFLCFLFWGILFFVVIVVAFRVWTLEYWETNTQNELYNKQTTTKTKPLKVSVPHLSSFSEHFWVSSLVLFLFQDRLCLFLVSFSLPFYHLSHGYLKTWRCDVDGKIICSQLLFYNQILSVSLFNSLWVVELSSSGKSRFFFVFAFLGLASLPFDLASVVPLVSFFFFGFWVIFFKTNRSKLDLKNCEDKGKTKWQQNSKNNSLEAFDSKRGKRQKEWVIQMNHNITLTHY